MDALEVTAIDREGAELEAFIELPWRIYGGEHRWVPPLRESVRTQLSDENLFFRHGRARPFLCRRAGEVVGRIVASADDGLAESGTGHFGFFETGDDPAVASALFAAAEEWLAGEGCRTVHGPVNLSVYGGYRLQTDGFDREPFLGEPRCPAYYRALVESAGFAPHASWRSWDLPRRVLGGLGAAVSAGLSRRAEGAGEYLPVDATASSLAEQLELLHPMIMECFAENYHCAPIDLAEFRQAFGPLLELSRPEFLTRWEVPATGEIAGFSFGYHDLARAFGELDGDGGDLAALAEAPRDRVVFFVFGVMPPHRKTNLIYEVMAHGLELCARGGYAHATGALVGEGPSILSAVGPPDRAYAVFEKHLG
ncbi:MAG: hypothetical protein QF903_15520 [Planctomycetota bacterium]|jgi:hypothetical protein|nr:hypothetical protein [Planctomycetota bacterium]MDP6762896.1 hypothetical protein [Planctomycetota bacterium]MDP6990878.1 hypothetical protein [Planctomycetota bacterium]